MERRSNDIKESRKKLSEEIERVRELEQKLADTRFKIASIKKSINIKKRRDGGIHEADHDEVMLKRLVSLESESSEALEIAIKNVQVLAEDIRKPDGLLSSDFPILLFPVRVETKFHINNSQGIKELLVRIYPDKIAIQTHEDQLTEDEIESGKVYWNSIWYKGKSNEDARKKAWGALEYMYGSARAAWVVRILEEHLENKDQWPEEESDERHAPKPIFKQIDSKPASWTKPPLTHIMPDRWFVITYVGEKPTHEVSGNPIPPNLNLGIDPMSQEKDEDDIGGEGELKVDEGIKWMVDFATAESKGMGIRINLTEAEREDGFTRIVVVGLKYSADENESTNLVKDLLESHHYTEGFAFVPQGTPTNNISDKRSGFSSRDANYKNSFEAEVSDFPLYNVTNDPYKAKDGEVVAAALGLDRDFFVHTENSGLSEHQDARHMGIALWPCTGYFLEEMMRPRLMMEDMILGRRFFIDNVRGRGPYSAIRIGDTPYGILPTSSLDRWESVEQEDGKIESFLPSFLKKLWHPHWEKPILDGRVPYIGRSTHDPDSNLLGILGMDPTSLEFYARVLVGRDFLNNLFKLLGKEEIGEKWWETHHKIASSFLNEMRNEMGFNMEAMPRIISMTFMKAYKVLLDTVYKPPLSETEPLPENDNYVRWLSTASLDDIKKRETYIVDTPNTLLYILLRYSILREYVSTSFRILKSREPIFSEEGTYEPELIIRMLRGDGEDNNNDTALAANTIFSGLKKVVPALSSDKNLEKYLDGIRSVENAEAANEKNLRELAEIRESLDNLKDIPTAKLERLMLETLDLFSHRLDAWITGLYIARLNKMRKETRGKKGIYIGGYGWAENIHPSPSHLKQPAKEVLADLPDHTRSAIAEQVRENRILPEPVISKTNAGFIHAPSLSQAAAAAILRNASISHRANGKDQFKINLSSERVKHSLWFLEGIRQGQPLAALLGYRFERGLHENHQSLELDQYIQPLRDLFPLNPRPRDSQNLPTTGTATTEPEESIHARDVVNGLEMLKAWRKGEFPFKKLDNMGDLEEDAKDAIEYEIQALDNIIDGISDLTLAESVFQMVQGDYTALAANLDAYSRGERPPEPAIIKTPHSGIRLTHRVMLVIFKDHPAMSDFWNESKNNPRAKAEPDLNNWLAKLLDNPSNIICKVKYKIAAATETKYVTLADLILCPLDFLELSITPAEQQQSEIDARVAHFILSKDPQGKDLEIVYAVSSDDLESDQVSFADALEFARKLRRFVLAARKILPEDLLLPEEPLEEPDSIAITKDVKEELVTRVKESENKLDPVIKSLQAASNREGLVQALGNASLFGVLGAFPDPQNGISEQEYIEYLKRKVGSTISELEKRQDRATKELQYKKDGDYADIINTAIAKIKEIFGSSFTILPKFTIPTSRSAELDNSLGNSARLLGGDEDTPLPWFQQAAKVRPLLSHYEDAIAFAEALKKDVLGFKVVQIPFNASDKWVALPFDKNNDEKDKPVDGKLSLVISPYGTADFASGKVSGLVIDDWIEVIPDDKETTGVAFHYDVPNSEPPQALLLAIPPVKGRSWELEDIIATVKETLDLAKVRAVDLDMVDVAAQFLPALYLTSGATKDNSEKRNIIDTDLERNNKLKRNSLTRGGP